MSFIKDEKEYVWNLCFPIIDLLFSHVVVGLSWSHFELSFMFENLGTNKLFGEWFISLENKIGPYL